MGLTGFDSELEWYVSMQCVGNLHLNLSYQAIIWQQYLCSRSVIEVQKITFISATVAETGCRSKALVPKRLVKRHSKIGNR